MKTIRRCFWPASYSWRYNTLRSCRGWAGEFGTWYIFDRSIMGLETLKEIASSPGNQDDGWFGGYDGTIRIGSWSMQCMASAITVPRPGEWGA